MTPSRSLFNSLVRRRAAALLYAVCIVVTQGEFLLPDIHDGDGAAGQVVLSGGTNEQSPTAPPDTPAPQSGHAAHVDHCAHTHLFATGNVPGELSSFSAITRVPDTASPGLTSISTPPHRRPPIA